MKSRTLQPLVFREGGHATHAFAERLEFLKQWQQAIKGGK